VKPGKPLRVRAPELKHKEHDSFQLLISLFSMFTLSPNYSLVSSPVTDINMAASLSTLPVEITYRVFKLLNRPAKLSLGLASPHFLYLFAKYFDLDRYRGEAAFDSKLGLPTGISWTDSAAQPVIIRWLAMSGGDDIDDPAPAAGEEPEEIEPDFNSHGYGFDDEELEAPYDESEEGKEDALVGDILNLALNTQFGVVGKSIFCADCYRYMRIHGPDGRVTPWAQNMMGRGL
jgi:hypothetical protein